MRDMISRLPQHVLHHILCYLPQKDAVRTCVLSKIWRHLGTTRPKIEFGRELLFNGNDEQISSVVNKTLQRYRVQNLSIQEFIMKMRECYGSIYLLEKWFSAVLDMGVKSFHFAFYGSIGVDLPLVLFKAESLKELYLEGCILSSVADKVHWKHLQNLSLKSVGITDATLEKIMSDCSLIEYLVVSWCYGLKTIKLTKAHSLKCFDCHDGDISIEIDAPSVESISISNCPNWIHHPYMHLPRLKSLVLFRVPLSNDFIDNISSNFPCLEKLSLSFFSDYEEFKLSSRSVKHLTIAVEGSFKAAIIDAANILCFEFSCKFLPSISLTTSSKVWKSTIRVGSTLDFNNDNSPWLVRLNELCKALCGSQISLHIDGIPRVVQDYCGDDLYHQPFVVENLSILGQSNSSLPDYLNCLFHIFHPKNIQQIWVRRYANFRKGEDQVIESLCKILLKEGERAQYFGQHELEDVIMEACDAQFQFYWDMKGHDENGEDWRVVEGIPSLSEFASWGYRKIRFRLKWTE